MKCLLAGRNEVLLKGVRKSLACEQNQEGDARHESHRIILGDVGNAEFWKEIKKEVSSVSVRCLLR